MYRIVLETWYQETPEKTYQEVYNKEFSSLEEACEYLGNNYKNILDEFPVQSLKIIYTTDF